MKERTYHEPVSDMAASLGTQGQSMLKCGAEMVAAGSNSAAGYDPRPWAHRAREDALAASARASDAGGHADAASAHLRAAEAMESRSSEALRLGWELEASSCAKHGAAHRKAALEHQRAALAMAPKKGMLAKALQVGRELLAKAQVKGYTKKDGTVVQQYSNKVAAALKAPPKAPNTAGMPDGHAKMVGDIQQAVATPGMMNAKSIVAGHAQALQGGKGAPPSDVHGKAVHEFATHAMAHMGMAIPHWHPDFDASKEGQTWKDKFGDTASAAKAGNAQISPNTSKVTAKPHPAKGFQPGVQVYHPHPEKAGKQGLGKYVGTTEDGAQSVVEHGGKQFAVDHDKIKGASGVPGGSKPPGADVAAAKKGGDAVRSLLRTNKSIKDHPNFNEDDYAALKGKGYDDLEIGKIWDKDTAQGKPGPNNRDDLKHAKEAAPALQAAGKALAEGPAKLSKKDALAQAKAEHKAAGAGNGNYAKAADLYKLAGHDDKAAEAAALAKRYGHDAEGQKAKGGADMELASVTREQAKKADPKLAKVLNDLADAYEARSKDPESNELTKKISALNDQAAALEGGATDAGGDGPTDDHLDLMEQGLANDENASDDELVDHWKSEGVPEHHAQAAIKHRSAFLTDPTPENGKLKKLLSSGGDVSREAQPGADAGAGAEGAETGAQGSGSTESAPPQADANEAGWDQLPDDENPKHAMSGMSSKALGAMATMKPEHAKAHAHAELANRGMDSGGNWKGFEQANAHHKGSIPDGFQPHPQVAEHMQTVKGKVLTAAAGGHLDLQKRARQALADRGHDTNGNFVGFQKAKDMHLGGGDMAKARPPMTRRQMLFVAAGDADLLRRRMDDATVAAARIGGGA